MSVVDASVFVDAVVGEGSRADSATRELDRHAVLQVPYIFAAEVTAALRGLVLRRTLSPAHATAALERVRRAATLQYPFEPFAPRVWELRHAVSVYDAWYVALAEGLGTELVTADRRLARSRGIRCPVRLVSAA
ncbi:MAG: type II toxin-antitoxin system VapC family toxin [Candidatus Dormibacteria bacterium]